jgi:hemerythrin-like domain-containing protein
MSNALDIIRREHRSIGAVLACLGAAVAEIEAAAHSPDFRLLSAIVDYLETFPEVFHHPKEEEHLFAALRRRQPELAVVLDDLVREHIEGVDRLDRLDAALVAFERDAAAFPALKTEVDAFIDFQRRHMRREEDEVLALAPSMLNDDDWRGIDAAFARNEDPLFGAVRRQEFDALFGRIVAFAPETVTVGVTGVRRKN